MSDLQSQLFIAKAKLQAAKQQEQANTMYDDDLTPQSFDAAVSDTPIVKTKKSERQIIWEAIRDNPNCTAAELSRHAGVAVQRAHGTLHAFLDKKLVDRKKSLDGYVYWVLGDEYPVFDFVAHGKAVLAKANAVLAANVEKRREERAAKVAKKLAIGAKVTPVDSKPVTQTKPVSAAFDPEELIKGLNPMQAKAVYLKLRELFGDWM